MHNLTWVNIATLEFLDAFVTEKYMQKYTVKFLI